MTPLGVLLGFVAVFAYCFACIAVSAVVSRRLRRTSRPTTLPQQISHVRIVSGSSRPGGNRT